MGRLKSLASILEMASQPEDVADRVAILREHDMPALRQILFYMYSPSVKFSLPAGDPPYTPFTQEDVPYRLYNEMRRLYLFIEGGHPTLTQPKREMLFVELLESVAPEDAILLIAVKDKKAPWKKLAKNVVQKAFPELLPSE